MTLEAVALHQLDNLDAKIHSFQQLMRDDPNVESCWTNFNQTLGRKLYKGTNGQTRVAEAVVTLLPPACPERSRRGRRWPKSRMRDRTQSRLRSEEFD